MFRTDDQSVAEMLNSLWERCREKRSEVRKRVKIKYQQCGHVDGGVFSHLCLTLVLGFPPMAKIYMSYWAG